MVGLCRPL
jgi:hypothetical protein